MEHLPLSMSETVLAQLPEQLMAKPAMSVDEFFVNLLGVPTSTMEQLLKEPAPPKVFLLGRRRYVLREDALTWLEHKAGLPYAPRKNNRRK